MQPGTGPGRGSRNPSSNHSLPRSCFFHSNANSGFGRQVQRNPPHQQVPGQRLTETLRQRTDDSTITPRPSYAQVVRQAAGFYDTNGVTNWATAGFPALGTAQPWDPTRRDARSFNSSNSTSVDEIQTLSDTHSYFEEDYRAMFPREDSVEGPREPGSHHNGMTSERPVLPTNSGSSHLGTCGQTYGISDAPWSTVNSRGSQGMQGMAFGGLQATGTGNAVSFPNTNPGRPAGTQNLNYNTHLFSQGHQRSRSEAEGRRLGRCTENLNLPRPPRHVPPRRRAPSGTGIRHDNTYLAAQ